MMAEPKVFQMSFAKVYGLLVSKAEKKGRTRAEVDTAARWLTGYTQPELDSLLESAVEEVADPLMREARYLDKLVDELAKGKPLEKVLRAPKEDQ